MKKRTKNIHKFIIPKTAGGHYDIKIHDSKSGVYKLATPSDKLRRVINRIYDLNYEKIQEADPNIQKKQFRNKIVSLMAEKTEFVNPTTGEVSYKHRTLNEAVRMVSRSTIFTTKEELGLENIRKNISRGKNPELRTKLALEFGVPYTYRRKDKDGKDFEYTVYRIPWKKLVWDKGTQSYRLNLGDGKMSAGGLKFVKKKKGKYSYESIFEFVESV